MKDDWRGVVLAVVIGAGLAVVMAVLYVWWWGPR